MVALVAAMLASHLKPTALVANVSRRIRTERGEVEARNRTLADWAREAASLRELRGVSRHCEGDLGRSFDLVDIAPSLHSFLMVRYAALDPEADWFERIDTETAFNRGLVEGAAAVYEVVRPLLASRDIAGAPKEQ
jgi:hypothetical protein